MPNSDESLARPKPGSRADRLMRTALEAEAANDAHTPLKISGANTASAAPRPGARARALNKRIRDVLREQTDAVFVDPQVASSVTASPVTASTDEGNNVPKMTGDHTAPARPVPAHSAAAAPQPVAPPTTSVTPKASSSWEDIANEIAPSGLQPRRGLATGAMRGPALRDPHAPKSHPVWRPAPEKPAVIPCPAPRPSALLHEAIQGVEKQCDVHGAHYLLSRPAHEYDSIFGTIHERMAKILEREVFPSLSGIAVEDLLFVDIETTGLSSSQPLFLIGALSLTEEAPLDLFLARDYPEERAALAAYHELAHGKTLVTFNGKSFDWPYIEGRSKSYRLNFKRPPAHLDLLHHARRQWKHSLPNCKLQTLELYLCGRTRVDDVPGSQIPRTYHEFVATHAASGRGAHLMAPILHHNALDILTMAELLCIAGEELA
jgi:uncharacterized protein YprB with RNaseH-like and TPR domain